MVRLDVRLEEIRRSNGFLGVGADPPSPEKIYLIWIRAHFDADERAFLEKSSPTFSGGYFPLQAAGLFRKATGRSFPAYRDTIRLSELADGKEHLLEVTLYPDTALHLRDRGAADRLRSAVEELRSTMKLSQKRNQLQGQSLAGTTRHEL